MGRSFLPSPEILSWMAGFWEGEGNIHISKRSPIPGRPGVSSYYALRICVVNTDKELLGPFLDFFGGFISTQKSKQTKHKDSYHWVLGGKKRGERFIRAIMPYVYSSRRRAQLEEALGFVNNTCRKQQGFCKRLDEDEVEQREGHYRRMKALHT